MNQARLPWTTISPKSYQAMASVGASIAKSSIGPVLMELVHTRVSQINGCAFCLDMHVRDLRKAGEGWQRINSLATWREVGLYSQRERAALNWAESITRLSDNHSSRDADFEELKGQFSDQEIVELTWAIAQINTWNRMAIGMQAPVVEKAID
ncbi:carboxymuconolactone decarboxylase family protein [Rhodoferax saidenbachensis]|uniref:Carboxymuconolactone decarboxylase family protein n=1 Tax=Rhodoferax saidenbachensis TaxID=1484693 RepID=A0A1P8K9Q6_9BURK|nr:carboxymuconolactone decarboxylase family protein [Rhodoferax saidenbachensis]APW42715.1 carboxymuconolactone decarboxylase family protein [Rhodoferax saidenbachensis]